MFFPTTSRISGSPEYERLFEEYHPRLSESLSLLARSIQLVIASKWGRLRIQQKCGTEGALWCNRRVRVSVTRFKNYFVMII